MTSACFGIAKVQCQKLNIIGYFFSLSYMSTHDLLKIKICKENKSKNNKNALYMIASMSFRRCESHKMYLDGDSLYQIVIIVCKLKWFSHISNYHNMYTLMQSCDVLFIFYLFFFHTQHAIFFATLDTCMSTMWFSGHKVYMC